MIRAGTADTTIKVAPLVGAWIEIQMQKLSVEVLEVAPLVGATILVRMFLLNYIFQSTLLQEERLI